MKNNIGSNDRLALKRNIKLGIYKQLYKNGHLSDFELQHLAEKLQKNRFSNKLEDIL